MTTFSPLSRKLIALGLLAYVLAIVWSAVVAPAWRWSLASIDALEDARFERNRAKTALIAARGVSEVQIAQLEELVAEQLIRAGNEAEAVNQLQLLAGSLTRQHGAVLESIQAAGSSPSGPLTRVSVDIRANATEEQIVRLLASVEQSVPLTRIERLSMRALDVRAAKAGPAPRIAFDVSLSAYWRPAPRGGKGAFE